MLNLTAGPDLARFQFRHAARGAELAAQHDGLADETALFTAVVIAPSNFVAGISHCGSRIKAGLSSKSSRNTQVGLRVSYRRVVGPRHAFKRFQLHAGGSGRGCRRGWVPGRDYL